MKKLLMGLAFTALCGNAFAGGDDWRHVGNQPDDDGTAWSAAMGITAIWIGKTIEAGSRLKSSRAQ